MMVSKYKESPEEKARKLKRMGFWKRIKHSFSKVEKPAKPTKKETPKKKLVFDVNIFSAYSDGKNHKLNLN